MAKKRGNPPPLRTLALRAVCASWHSGVDLGSVPVTLCFVVWERLRALRAGDSMTLSCAEMYPWVRSKWQLESLDLGDSREWLTDASMNALCYVLSLRSISLVGARVSDAGMGFLVRQQALRELDLSWCSALGDAFLHHLVPLAGSMVSLNLTGTAITDAGLPTVLQLTSLQRLGLGNTAITDKGMDYLTYYSRYTSAGPQGLHSLECLSLACTAITDVGLLKLCATQGGVVFKKLRLLVLSSTNGLSGRAVNEVRLKYKLSSPLPNTPRTLALTNRDAMMGESWLTRISPADERRPSSAKRFADGQGADREASWLVDGLVEYIRQFTNETHAASYPSVGAPPASAKRKYGDATR
ncbi:hypothetical protein T492DRAFT_1059362 [Pavlovales sp. CCMP2436]|nr:hypothetical protein T492DRAFT_1059362 [Pavlovales sp. CCMP2436]|mmetsp:Transcript_17902/g.45833  ORF Transcript_17902/g.45833 Transcript_17902/m.45833 type:complete len:355 (-) Transcript_17902:76-1140(-)